jgi:hypothetical protein
VGQYFVAKILLKFMPSKTPKQQRFMGADYARAERGEKTQTGMTRAQLRDFACKPKGGYPGKKSRKKK